MKKKRPTVYAFIDSQNLNMGVGSDVFHNDRRIYKGWKLDFKKFRKYLKDKHRVDEAFLFIGNLPGQESMYAFLQRCGYILVLKPTTTYKNDDGSTNVKGNVDTDIVLYAAAKEIDNFDSAVIVTGDGDFLSLCEYLEEREKLRSVVVPNKHNYSQLLKRFIDKFDYVSVNKKKLEKAKSSKKASMSLSDARDKVTRYGDTSNIAKKNLSVKKRNKT